MSGVLTGFPPGIELRCCWRGRQQRKIDFFPKFGDFGKSRRSEEEHKFNLLFSGLGYSKKSLFLHKI